VIDCGIVSFSRERSISAANTAREVKYWVTSTLLQCQRSGDNEIMSTFSFLDGVAFLTFVLAWLLYHRLVEATRAGEQSLNGLMDRYRIRWMERLHQREERIFDTQVMAGLQNGTAFFASTSLFAFGGALALLRAADDVFKIFADLPFGIDTSRAMWEIKVAGLAIIFVYAFFKFAWSYRLFNYAAILIGASPRHSIEATGEIDRHTKALAAVVTDAGRQFNRGQRAFFFALAYVGWFVSPVVLIVTTTAALLAMLHRQFRSASHDAVKELVRSENLD
jgi:uncharacterized membrane protein